MAEITLTQIGLDDTQGTLQLTPATGSDFFTLDNADQRVTLLIQNQNTQAATVSLKAGDGLLASKGNYTVTAPAGGTAVVPMSRVDSARVKKLAGTDGEKVFLTTTVAPGGSLSSILLAVISVA